MTGQLEGKIGLHAPVDIGLAARILGPPSLGELCFHQASGAPAGQIGVLVTEEGQQQDRFALQRGVALQFAAP